MNPGSGCSFIDIAPSIKFFSKSMSLLRGTSSAGNRSPIRPINTGVSSVTIFGILKSRNALINT